MWRILVEMGGAHPSHEVEFMHYLTKEVGMFAHEFRFQGHLGFGGKFHNGTNYRFSDKGEPYWYVSCYLEDETPERKKLIEQMDHALAQVWLMERVRTFLAEVEIASRQREPHWAEEAHNLLWYLDAHVIAPLRS